MEKNIQRDRVYTVEEAAQVIGVNPRTLLEYLREGKIVGKKIGKWKILGQSLVNFLSTGYIVHVDSFHDLNSEQWIPRVWLLNWMDKELKVKEWKWEEQMKESKQAADIYAKFAVKQLVQYYVTAE